MAKTKLFEAWSFRLQQPAPFDDPKYAGSKSMGFSQYNTSSTAQKSTLHAPTMRALLAYAKLVSATENGQSVDGLGAIGHQGTTYRISEYRSANKTDCVVFNPVTGKFNAAQVEDGTQALKPYSVGAGNGTGSGLLFCLMPVLNEDDEFRQKFQEFVSLLESGWADMDAAFECALTLCDNVYRRIENSKQLGSDGVKISIPTTGNISVITQMAMDSGNYAPTGASYGEFTIMQMSGTPTAKASSFQKEDFVAKYALSNRTLTARELAMVPTLPDWYIIPKEVVRVCEHAKVTTASSQPMRNFLFRGEAGTGKTMGAQAIAAGLNLPYTLMTCSANTEITDLVGQFIPDTGNFQSDFNCTELPKISDITMHPPSVYMMLTGEYDEEKTEDDVLACGYTDLRRGIDGLAGIVRTQFQMDPFQTALFLFCGRRRDRIKALYWEGDGFLLLYKRLESGSFQWPRTKDEVRTLTPQQYRWLMEGLKTEQPKANKAVSGLSAI